MKTPQDVAKAIGDYGCCAFVALWALGIEPKTDAEAIELVAEAMEKGAVEKDCTVKWIEFARLFTGKNIKVEFMEIKSLIDLNKKKSICGRIPVRFDYDGNSHWVGVEDGKVAFNPLEKSRCVEYGKPTKARIMTWQKLF